jgi:hypothetical protein
MDAKLRRKNESTKDFPAVLERAVRRPRRIGGIRSLIRCERSEGWLRNPSKLEPVPPIPFVSPSKNAPANRADDDDSRDSASIVGLWHVIYTATSVPISIPEHPYDFSPPFPFFESYKIWHGDGTEWENAFLPPTGGMSALAFGKTWATAKSSCTISA